MTPRLICTNFKLFFVAAMQYTNNNVDLHAHPLPKEKSDICRTHSLTLRLRNVYGLRTASSVHGRQGAADELDFCAKVHARTCA